MSNAIVPINVNQALDNVKRMAEIVRQLRADVFKEGLDFGVIPGTGDKPTLYLPGMEKAMRALGVVPDFIERRIIVDYDRPLFHYEYECRLVDAETGVIVPGGDGIGLCTSMESAFRWRDAKRTCPKCGAATINKSKFAPRNNPQAEPGWYCHAKVGGCGAEFAANDAAITGQTIGRMENPDVFDHINAICKRAQKRALGSAIKGAANISEFFTVDIEDFPVMTVSRPLPDDAVEGDYTEESTSSASTSPTPRERMSQQHGPIGREDKPAADGPAAWTVETLKKGVIELFQNEHNYYHAIKNYRDTEHDEFMLPADLTLEEAEARIRFYRSRTGKAEQRIFEDAAMREKFIGSCAGVVDSDRAIVEALDAITDYPVGSLTAWKGDKATAWAAVLAAGGLYITRQAVPESAKPLTAALVTLICEHVTELSESQPEADPIPA